MNFFNNLAAKAESVGTEVKDVIADVVGTAPGYNENAATDDAGAVTDAATGDAADTPSFVSSDAGAAVAPAAEASTSSIAPVADAIAAVQPDAVTITQPTAPAVETDPNGLVASQPGAKLDAGKPQVLKGVLQYFPRALLEVAKVSEFGASKYSWGGWESVIDGAERYAEAEIRHVLKEAIEGVNDAESAFLHKAHKAWNALAELELFLREREKGATNA